jgi:hypothetical protein
MMSLEGLRVCPRDTLESVRVQAHPDTEDLMRTVVVHDNNAHQGSDKINVCATILTTPTSSRHGLLRFRLFTVPRDELLRGGDRWALTTAKPCAVTARAIIQHGERKGHLLPRTIVILVDAEILGLDTTVYSMVSGCWEAEIANA